jgi:DNA segregation ATPase FtsK/SpoIIIE, S-DNA-T family
MRRVVTGEDIAQVRNPDPFAPPAWRSPVYQTPGWIVAAVQLLRTLWWLARFLARHPIADLVTAALAVTWFYLGWPGLLGVTLGIVTSLGVWWRCWPTSFSQHVVARMRRKWRAWFYRRRWAATMTIANLAVLYQQRLLLPVLGKVEVTGCVDRVHVGLVSGQSAADFAARSDNLAHGFGALLCRVRSHKPGMLVLEFVRKDALTAIIPALSIPANPDLRALAIGRREDGLLWTIRLQGTHLLIAGSTGAGKASLLWSIVCALLAGMRDGLVRVLAADPKLMELAYGRAIFDRYGAYAADPTAIVAMLEAAVADMQARAASSAGLHRHHSPTTEHPFVVILVDEVAFLTCYQPDRKLRDRTLAALATLTTQGRAVGYCVVAALQDPRKEVLSIRNLFPDRIVMRLDEPEQVDLVLGDGARDRGALADLISPLPETGAGVAYTRLEGHPDPVRARAAWVSDTDIRAMCADYAPEPGLRAIEAGAA